MSDKPKKTKIRATNKSLGRQIYEYRWIYALGIPGLVVMLLMQRQVVWLEKFSEAVLAPGLRSKM